MTKDYFDDLVSNITVQTVADIYNKMPAGFFIVGLAQAELAEIITLASQKLGSFPEDIKLNPVWLSATDL